MARGIGNNRVGGAYDVAAQGDLSDGDAFELQPTLLSGSADVIPPHQAGNYIVKTAGVDAMTLGAPTPGTDDNLSISIFSDTLNAHTVTATALFANGTALKTTATFAAFRGAGMTLRAFNGVWQIVGASGVSFT
jgi:hypothetical protein